MGGRGRSRTQRKHFRQSRENVWKRSKSDDTQNPENSSNSTPDDTNDSRVNRDPGWQPFATQNTGFDEYYKEQEIVSQEEWDTFIKYLRTPLPAAFRINSSSQFYRDIRLQLENDFTISLQAEDIDGCEVVAIKPLPWYPNNLAWHSNFSRNQLRKNQTLERFHEFLKLENETGNITRQEAVSMVPPLFLDVKPHHFVLDMCAAPGSKTFQLLEMIHQLTEPGTLPSGMVIANDLDVQRCNLLIHQTKRMCTSNLIVTNHEAQHFPSCHLHRNRINSSEFGNREDPGITQLQFDRVLCDVPCSGDGTLRKAPDIWRKWNPGNGNGLHGLQVQIGMRGISLLKVGGRMIYSTCSMNPIENEAVVAEILRRCEGSIELVDVSSELPQLIRRPGLKKWKVRDKGVWFTSYKDVPKYRRSVVTSGMFPSGKTYEETSEQDHETVTKELVENGKEESTGNGLQMIDDPVVPPHSLEAEVSTLPLEHCMRIVPHDQNTGAFFIAVFHKLSPLAVTQEKTVILPKKMDSSNAQAEMSKNDAKEESDGVEIDSTGGTEGQLSEATIDADILENEIDDAALDTDINVKSKENEKEEAQPYPDTKIGAEVRRGKRKQQIQGKWRGVDPVLFYRDDTVIDSIMEFYGIKESFPFKGHLITRNIDNNHVKRIYYISQSVKDVLELNLLTGQHLKIASVGLKMFERQTSKEGTTAPCLFRISSEGLPVILPHITKQILYASAIDFKHLLQYKIIKFSDFVNPVFGEKASKLVLGCCAVILRRDDNDLSEDQQVDASTVAIGCWRGRTNVAVMVTAIDCQELLERLSVLKATETAPEQDNSSSQLKAHEIGHKNDSEIEEGIKALTQETLA